MAVGNTFGATALSSYGGFWIAYGILLTPNWNILGKGGPYDATLTHGDPKMGNSAVGFFLTGWFIFTTILLLCTLRSTVMFFLLFFTLDLAFLMLACGEYATNNGAAKSAVMLTKAGGGFGMLAAFLAWYNAFAGIADSRSVNFPCHVSSVFVLLHHARCPVVMRETIICASWALVGEHLRAAKPPSGLGSVSHLRQRTVRAISSQVPALCRAFLSLRAIPKRHRPTNLFCIIMDTKS
jgi:succinate-acetate transporter protein